MKAAESSEIHSPLAEGQPIPLLVADKADYDRPLDSVFYERPFIPGQYKHDLTAETVVRQPHHQAIWNSLREAWGFQPPEGRLRGLKVPTIIVWGGQGRVLHVSGAKMLAAAGVRELTGEVCAPTPS